MKPAAVKYTTLLVFTLYFLVILIWGIALEWTGTHTGVWNYGYNLGYAGLYLVGGLMGLWGARYVTTEIAMGNALLYLGAAQISYASGLILWAYYNLVAHVAVPYPSAADVFFALFYVLLAVGCWNFLSMVATHVRVQHLFEVMAIFFVSAVVIVGFLNTPDTSPGLSILTKIVNIWYPLGDSLLIALSYLVFRAGRDKFQTGMLILIIGLLVQVSADLIFSYRTSTNVYWNGDISDMLFAVSGFILSFGILNVFFDFISSAEGSRPTA